MATLMSGGALGDELSPGEATQDALFGGSVVLFQPPRGAGYRTNVDALLLAGFADGAQGRRRVAFDLGAGVGAVGLALLRLGAARRVVFVEIDERPAAMSRRNLDANGWTERGEVVRGDVRDVARSRRGEASLVVCNPPYVVPGRGRVPAAQARARSGELGTFVEAARQLAGSKARVCFVYPAAGAGDAAGDAGGRGAPRQAPPLRPRDARGAGAHRPRRGSGGPPGGLNVLPPLVERGPRGYTPEMQALLARG